MKKLLLITLLLTLAAPVWATGLNLGMRLGTPAPDRADIKYDGRLAELTADGKRLRDYGLGHDDHGTVYSGQMLDFDGVDDDIVVADIPIGSSAVTIAYTIKTTDTLWRASWYIAFSERCYFGNSVLGIGDAYGLHELTLNDGEYHRVIIVRNGDDATMYVDGVTGFELSGCGEAVWTQADVYFGSNEGVDKFINGQIGNVQVWDAAWTADDVTYDYANPETTADNRSASNLTSANLKGWWPLIEGAGTTAYDWSGNSNNGTLTGFTTPGCWENADKLSDIHVMQTAFMEWGLHVTSALVPLGTALSTDFERNNNQLNYNYSSYSLCGNGDDVNPSSVVIIECTVTSLVHVAQQYFYQKNLVYGLYAPTAVDSIGGYIGIAGVRKFVDGTASSDDSHHVVLSYDGATVRMHVDGVCQADQEAATGAITSNSNPLYVGSQDTSTVVAASQLYFFKLYGDAEAQRIIDNGLDAWVTKRYNSTVQRYATLFFWGLKATDGTNESDLSGILARSISNTPFVAVDVDFSWTANTDVSAFGYNIYRTTDPNGTWTKLNSSMVTNLIYTDNITSN